MSGPRPSVILELHTADRLVRTLLYEELARLGLQPNLLAILVLIELHEPITPTTDRPRRLPAPRAGRRRRRRGADPARLGARDRAPSRREPPDRRRRRRPGRTSRPRDGAAVGPRGSRARRADGGGRRPRRHGLRGRPARAVFPIRNGAVTRFAEYGEPLDVAVDTQGTVFVTGRAHTVVRVEADGTAARYAGTGTQGASGDGGPALAATFDAPHGIAIDPDGNVAVAEVGSVRRIVRGTGVVERVVGNGSRQLCAEQAPPLRICLSALRIGFAPDGTLWVADPENRRLWRVAAGEARAYALGFAPFDVAVEPAGTVLVADNDSDRIVLLRRLERRRHARRRLRRGARLDALFDR